MADPVSLGFTIGLTLLQTGLNANRRIEGPRVEDLTVTVADYDTVLNYFVGTRRFEANPIIFAEDIREVKKRRKTKGGKFNDYSYFGTWASVVADHEIDAVSRIWFDKHLVYDATGAGPVTPFEGLEGFNLSDNIRVYLGTELQMPDPRMTATVEAKHGAGSNPAYRGVSYVFHEETPLEKFGNRVPQESIEAVRSASAAYPFEAFDVKTNSANRLWGASFSKDFTRFVWSSGFSFELYDIPTRSLLLSGSLPAGISLQGPLGVKANGNWLAISANGLALYEFSPDFQTVATIFNFTINVSNQDQVRVLTDGNGVEHWITLPYSFLDNFFVDGVELIPAEIGDGTNWQPRDAFKDSHGDLWVVGSIPSVSVNDDMFMYRVVNTGARPGSPGFAHFTGLPAVSAFGTRVYGAHFGSNFTLSWATGYLYLIDEDTLTITDSRSLGQDVYNTSKQFGNLAPGASSIWLNTNEISLSDLSTIRTVSLSNWSAQDADGLLYSPLGHSLIGFPQFTQQISFRPLDRISGNGVTLQTVVETLAAGANMDPADIDASALTQNIDGFSWTQGTGKEILDPLLDVHDSIIRPTGYVLQGRKLGDASGGTIDSAEFAAAEGESPFRVTIDADSDLPRRVTVSFSDINADQQRNSALVQRPVGQVDGVAAVAIDLRPLAAEPGDMQQYAERWTRRRWFEQERYDLNLTGQQLALDPGDVRTLNLEGIETTARLDVMAFDADGVITTQWVRDDPAISELSGSEGAEMDGHRDSVMLIPTPSKGFVLDIPLVRDVDENVNPLLYLASGPYAAGFWPGANVFQSDDGAEYNDEVAGIPTTNPATWGYANTALADANPWLWDRGNSVNIDLKSGVLTGTTEELCDISGTLNLCYLGGELMQFTSAVLEGDGSWTLSGFKRGRRGTDFATAGHAAGDEFLLLDAYALLAMGASDIGVDQYFKTVTSGRDVSTALPNNFNFSAASLKPYSPVDFEAIKDPVSGDWDMTWKRRTRIGGDWTGDNSLILGEASEAYEVDILDGPSVVRTINVTSESAEYLDADQITDFSGTQSTITARLYQISAVAGRGFVNEETFT